MLLVKTRIAESQTHGIGLFSAENIPQGTVIWRFDARIDRIYTKSEREALTGFAGAFIKMYSYPLFLDSEDYVLDGDHARFMNHSDNPNTDCHVDTIATRDIMAGEELLCDYRQFHPGHQF